MRDETVTYRRRADGILEILRPSARIHEAVRGTELAVSLVAIAVGVAGMLTRNVFPGVVLLVAGFLIMMTRPVVALRASRKRRVKGPPATQPSNDPTVGLRVIRFEEHASPGARPPETALRRPGTAASPQE